MSFLCSEHRAVDPHRFRLGRAGFVCLWLDTPLAIRIPTVVADQVFALIGNVLRDFGQKVQRAEDLEVAFRAGEAAALLTMIRRSNRLWKTGPSTLTRADAT